MIGSLTSLPQESFCLTGPALQAERSDLQFPCVGQDAKLRTKKISNTGIGINQIKNHSPQEDRPCTTVRKVRKKASFSYCVLPCNCAAAKMKVTITSGLPCVLANTHQCNGVLYVKK